MRTVTGLHSTGHRTIKNSVSSNPILAVGRPHPQEIYWLLARGNAAGQVAQCVFIIHKKGQNPTKMKMTPAYPDVIRRLYRLSCATLKVSC